MAWCEGQIKAKKAEQARELEPLNTALHHAEGQLRESEAEILNAMDDAGVDTLHSDARGFTVYIQDTSGWRVIDEARVIEAFTERGIPVPWQKPPKPKLNQTKAKAIAVERLGGDVPGMEYVEHRTVQVKGSER
ncbi:MAG: hypothetical protein IT335_04215 [Thermomicrobiales bacterium]|nr:hypothetical protein [Thermomicrobiales bacterium]